jgi:hypothetical protein
VPSPFVFSGGRREEDIRKKSKTEGRSVQSEQRRQGLFMWFKRAVRRGRAAADGGDGEKKKVEEEEEKRDK